MTTIEFSHRDRIATTKENDYVELHDRIIDRASTVNGIFSIVSCGSFVKGTLVPGWSDLDIVIFHESTANQWLFLQELSGIMSELSELSSSHGIGVGIDVVSIDTFRRTLRLGGRPLAMSCEVAGYGRISFGLDPFDEVVWTTDYFRMARSEALIACRAIIHNWRRHVIARRKTDEPVRNLLYDTKVGLKILKHESDPNTGPSYTYDTALSNVKTAWVDRFPSLLFEQCIETRKSWAHVVENRNQVTKLGLQIPELLSRYREPEE